MMCWTSGSWPSEQLNGCGIFFALFHCVLTFHVVVVVGFYRCHDCRLKWEVDELKEEIQSATVNLACMIQDSDMVSFTAPYGKAVPKKFRLSPDGWFQVRRGEGCGRL